MVKGIGHYSAPIAWPLRGNIIGFSKILAKAGDFLNKKYISNGTAINSIILTVKNHLSLTSTSPACLTFLTFFLFFPG